LWTPERDGVPPTSWCGNRTQSSGMPPHHAQVCREDSTPQMVPGEEAAAGNGPDGDSGSSLGWSCRSRRRTI
jgi:hypothetical protein